MKMCPKCKSKNIVNKITLSAAWGFPQKKKCLDCGFESHMYAEKKEKVKKKSKRRKLIINKI